MSMSRRTFHKVAAMGITLLVVPVKSIAHSVVKVVRRKQYGTYMIAAFAGSQEKSNYRIWPRISADHTWDVIRKAGVYEAATDTWWIKLVAYKAPFTDLRISEWQPSGGVSSQYSSLYFAHCENGQVVCVRKNRLGQDQIAPAALHHTGTALLWPQQILMNDEAPVITVL